MKRWLAAMIVFVVLGAIAIGLAPQLLGRVVPPIRVGLLHSQTGVLAISEKSMIDAEVLALEEINAAGGLLGHRRVEWVIADGRSDGPTFAREAERLIGQEKVSVIFGCWASASRKSVKPVVEQHQHLLFYPNAYEGLEESPHIVYTGAAPNQQVIPAVKWCYDRLKARRYFLAGSDYVWPRCVNAIVKDYLKALGAEVVGEEYILFGRSEVDPVVAAIGRAKPDVVISTVAGDTNLAFYPRLAAAGLGPQQVPVIAFGIAEDELRKLPVRDLVGDYASWGYFQSVDSPENREFVRKFQGKYGTDRVTSDVIVAAYNSVQLWAQAVSEAETDQVPAVLKALRRQSLDAPEGVISVDAATLHTWRPVYIGRIRGDGQFDVVWRSEKSVRPIPFPTSRARSGWEAFLDELHRGWGGWANPGQSSGPRSKPGSGPRDDRPAGSSAARTDAPSSAGRLPDQAAARAAFPRTSAAARCDRS